MLSVDAPQVKLIAVADWATPARLLGTLGLTVSGGGIKAAAIALISARVKVVKLMFKRAVAVGDIPGLVAIALTISVAVLFNFAEFASG